MTYVAPGPTAAADPDPDWAARIAAHRRRRPPHWTTLETHDLAGALHVDGHDVPVFITARDRCRSNDAATPSAVSDNPRSSNDSGPSFASASDCAGSVER